MNSDSARILVIEDSEDDRLLYRRSLKKASRVSFTICEASSGEEGLAYLERESFACVLLDYSLPGRDGVEILKRIRVKHPFVPVVMLSGLGNEKIAVAAMQHGAQDYICKTAIDPQALVHGVQLAIAQGELQSRIAEQRRSLEVFARALAHDLKEPVRTIRSLLDLAGAETSIAGKAGGYLQSARNVAERMNALIDTVYFYTQLDSAEQARREPCGAGSLIDQATDNIRWLIDERQAVIVCGSMPEIAVNREQLVQVFQNLLSNAIQHGPSSPRIDISADETPTCWRFRVSDNGTGIAKQDVEKLFLPFKRLSRHHRQGPGLGLATCKKILGLHGGEIWFEQGPEGGAQFLFTIPKRAATGASQAAPPSMPATAGRPAGARRMATILMVDDDDMALELAQIQLIDSHQLQCGVIVARNGAEALARLHDTEIDLVLLDINMPGMDGFELLSRMRSEPRLDRVAVVMCSTSTYQEDISKARQLGACGYLTKPPDFSRLKSILQNSTDLDIAEVGDTLQLLRVAEPA